MAEKYNLKEMLKDISENETEESKERLKLSRDGLKKMVAQKRKAREESSRG